MYFVKKLYKFAFLKILYTNFFSMLNKFTGSDPGKRTQACNLSRPILFHSVNPLEILFVFWLLYTEINLIDEISNNF